MKIIPKIGQTLFFVILAACGFALAQQGFNRVKSNLKTPAPVIKQNNILKKETPELPVEQNIPIQAPPIAPENLTPPSLTLSGIFFSNDEGLALINNRVLKEGDKIDGAVIKRITPETVELSWQDQNIRLSLNIPR